MKKRKNSIFCEIRRCRADSIVIIASICIFLFIGILSRALSESPLYMLRLAGITDKVPPVWTFIIVWSIWYILLGFCFGFVISGCFYGKDVHKFKGSLCLIIMMIFNIIWYPLFFSAKSSFLALIDLVLIILFAFLTFIEYKRLSKIASFIIFLHILYLIWCFVTNFKIFISI